jgi:hypothetical protein
MNKRQTIQIDTASGKRSLRVRIIAPGLAVHLSVAFPACPLDYDFWTVTHIPSGRLICFAPTQPQAAKIAKALAELADWSTIGMNGTVSKALRRKARRVIDDKQEEWPAVSSERTM